MNPTAVLLEPEVSELITEGRFSELRGILHQLEPADVGEIFAALDPARAALAFRFLQRDDAGLVFSYLDAARQQELIDKLGDQGSLRVVEAMSADDRAALLDELPAEVAQRLIASLPSEARNATRAILGYPATSVGRLMTPDYVRVRPEWTIAKALDHVRRHGRDAETINVVYVVDDKGTLVDDIRLRQLLLSEPEATVESIMNRQFIALRADQDREEAVRAMARYDRIALPVVDSTGALIGIVTSDDVADAAQAIVTEDILKLGGLEALDQAYLKTGFREMYHKRGFWLSALFVGQSVTILVLGGFQSQIEKAAELAVLMPLVISCGGNSGSQAAALVTRALALGEVKASDWARIVGREALTAVLLGITLGAMGFLCVAGFTQVLGHPSSTAPWRLGLTVAVSIAAVVLWGTIVGSLLPLALQRLGFDPATASSPMVATLMDASGTIIYFGFALLVLLGAVA